MTIFNERGGEIALGNASSAAPRVFALRDGGFVTTSVNSFQQYDAFGSPVGQKISFPIPGPFSKQSPAGVLVSKDGVVAYIIASADQGGTTGFEISYFDLNGQTTGVSGLLFSNGPSGRSQEFDIDDTGTVFVARTVRDELGSLSNSDVAFSQVNQKRFIVTTKVNALTDGTQDVVDVISLPGGAKLVTFESSASTSTLARFMDQNGNPSGREFAIGPSVNGNIKVVYADGNLTSAYFDPTSQKLTFARYDTGGQFLGKASDASLDQSFTSSGQTVSRVISDVDVLPDGRYLVSFEEPRSSGGNETGSDSILRIYDLTGLAQQTAVQVGAPILLDNVATGKGPTAAVLANGDVVTSWYEGGDLGNPGVVAKAQIFDVVANSPTNDVFSFFGGPGSVNVFDAGIGIDHAVTQLPTLGRGFFQRNGSDHDSQVTRLYENFLGRTPDKGGFDYWVGRLDAGESLLDVARSFADSSEFRSVWGNPASNQDFVSLAYQKMFGRTADAGGLQYWTGEVSTSSRLEVLLRLSEAEVSGVSSWIVGGSPGASNDGPSILTNVERVVFADGIVALDTGRGEHAGEALRMYDTAFNRVADRGGLTYWTRQLDAGLSLEAMAQAFINSAEGTDLRTASNTDFVKALYQRGLEREADSGGLTYWVGRVAADGKAAVLAEISESAEHFELLQNQIATPVILDRYTIPGV